MCKNHLYHHHCNSYRRDYLYCYRSVADADAVSVMLCRRDVGEGKIEIELGAHLGWPGEEPRRCRTCRPTVEHCVEGVGGGQL